MSAPAPEPGPRGRLAVWWTIWTAIFVTEIPLYLLLARGPLPPPVAARQSLADLVGMIPLFLSIVTRWLVLPRLERPQSALVAFFVGLGLAQAAAILGLFLGGPYRDMLFVVGMLATAQFAPFFARRFYVPASRMPLR